MIVAGLAVHFLLPTGRVAAVVVTAAGTAASLCVSSATTFVGIAFQLNSTLCYTHHSCLFSKSLLPLGSGSVFPACVIIVVITATIVISGTSLFRRRAASTAVATATTDAGTAATSSAFPFLA